MNTFALTIIFIGMMFYVNKQHNKTHAVAASNDTVTDTPITDDVPAGDTFTVTEEQLERYVQQRINEYMRANGAAIVARVMTDTVDFHNKGYVLEASGKGVLATKAVVGKGTVQYMMTCQKTVLVRGKHVLEAMKQKPAPATDQMPADMPPLPEYR